MTLSREEFESVPQVVLEYAPDHIEATMKLLRNNPDTAYHVRELAELVSESSSTIDSGAMVGLLANLQEEGLAESKGRYFIFPDNVDVDQYSYILNLVREKQEQNTEE